MQDKSELCNTLYQAAQDSFGTQRSLKCKNVLWTMQRLGSLAATSQEKIKLFFGGVVLAMTHVQLQFDLPLSAMQIVQDAQVDSQKIDLNLDILEMIRQIGQYIYDNPQRITIEFFEQIIIDQDEMVYFFPKLYLHKQEIGGLLKEIALVSEKDKNLGSLPLYSAFFASSQDEPTEAEYSHEESYSA